MEKKIIVSDSLATVMIQLHVELLTNVWWCCSQKCEHSIHNCNFEVSYTVLNQKTTLDTLTVLYEK